MAKHLQQPDNMLPAIKEGLTKKQIAELASQSVEHLLEDGDVLRVAEALASMEEFTKAVRKDERYVQYLREELSRYGGRSSTSSGARIELCEAGVNYDYSSNAEWRELEQAIAELLNRKKALETRLRSIAPGKIAVDEETGEVFEGAQKNSRSTYRVTLARH